VNQNHTVSFILAAGTGGFAAKMKLSVWVWFTSLT
jgi:hypothetical protein